MDKGGIIMIVVNAYTIIQVNVYLKFARITV